MTRPAAAQDSGVGYPLATYRYVRLALVAVVAGLLASMVLAATSDNCWQTSISAFYYTVAHAVFIGALCAVGVCLISYKGLTTPEDILLNFAGFLAFVVALVPTSSPLHNPKDPATSCGLWLPTHSVATAAVGNNVIAVLVGAAVGIVTYLVVRAQAGPAPGADVDHGARRFEPDRPPRPVLVAVADFVLKWVQVAAPVLTAAALAAGLLWFLIDRDSFSAGAHSAAAIAMFSGIIAVVVLYACYSLQHFCHCRARGRFTVGYITIAAVMSATLVVVGVLHVHLRTWNYAILGLEIALIVEFAAFWLLQTLDSWNGQYRPVVPRAPLRPAATTASAEAD